MNDVSEGPAKESAGPAGEGKYSCPLLSAGMIAGVGKNRSLPCVGRECAWWDVKESCCVILARDRG